MDLLFALAALVAVAAVATRIVRQRIAERRRPGGRPSTAIAVEDYGDIDLTVRLQVCPCGGAYVLLGEGPPPGVDRHLRAVHLQCGRCERGRRLYFDLSGVRH